MKKTLTYLIETELEQAEIILAAKSIPDKLQQMAETLAKAEGNDVMPLGDAMREVFGPEAAESFEKSVSGTLRELIETIRNAKNDIFSTIEALESGETDMDKIDDVDDLFSGDTELDDFSPESEEEDASEEDAAGEEDAADEEDEEDEFSDEQLFGDNNPIGREKKESFNNRKSVIEGKIVKRFRTLIKNGASPLQAANKLAESTNRPIERIADIIIRRAKK